MKQRGPLADTAIARIRHRNRREFVKGLGALAGATSLLGFEPNLAVAEPPPETTKIRLAAVPAICFAPQYLAEALLRTEGFTEIQYSKLEGTPAGFQHLLLSDISMESVGPAITFLDAGQPMVVMAGVHLGCYELFGSQRVRAIRDLKGKRVAIDGFGGGQHVFLSSMASYVGMDPSKDIDWIVSKTSADSMQLFVEGKADAFLGFPPEPQELRRRKVGHVVVNTAFDPPWSEYYCCMLTVNRDFAAKHPIATKRALRAILKAADLCAEQPERSARAIVDGGFSQSYEFTLETLKEVRYNAWRTYNPENTIRFHALRLREAGIIKSDPNKLIAQGTDWRFLNELRKELKT